MTCVIWSRLNCCWFWDLTGPWLRRALFAAYEDLLSGLRFYTDFVRQRWKISLKKCVCHSDIESPLSVDCTPHRRDHIKKAFKPPKVFLTSDFKGVPLQNCTRSSCLLIIWSGMREAQLISPSAIQWSMLQNVKLENYVVFLIFLWQTSGFITFHYIH